MHTYTVFVQGDNLSWKCHYKTHQHGMNANLSLRLKTFKTKFSFEAAFCEHKNMI